MSARTRRKPKASDPKLDQLVRLSGLNANAVDLIQSGQREPAMVDALLNAHQLFKENKLGGTWAKIRGDEYRLSKSYRECFFSMKEGETWKLDHENRLSCGERSIFLPAVRETNKREDLQSQAQIVMHVINPMLTIFLGLELQFSRAIGDDDGILRIITKDMDVCREDDQHTIDEFEILAFFEFEVVKVS